MQKLRSRSFVESSTARHEHPGRGIEARVSPYAAASAGRIGKSLS
tara:strand:+ start:133 stop:267 length:135 start_codon:yes stop_codon:yes gene_type:complete